MPRSGASLAPGPGPGRTPGPGTRSSLTPPCRWLALHPPSSRAPCPPSDAAARQRRVGPQQRPPAAYTCRRTDCRNTQLYAMAFQSISRDFFIGWRGEQDLSLLRVNFAHGALAEGGVPCMEADSSRQCCPVAATRAAAQSLESCPVLPRRWRSPRPDGAWRSARRHGPTRCRSYP